MYYVQDSKGVRKVEGDIDLIVLRVHKTGSLTMAKPCFYCCPKIKSFGIRYVYYSVFEQYITREKASEMISTHVCTGQRLSSKCE